MSDTGPSESSSNRIAFVLFVANCPSQGGSALARPRRFPFVPNGEKMAKPKKQKQQKPKTPKYKTIAEAFAAKAEDEQKRHDMYEKLGVTVRGS